MILLLFTGASVLDTPLLDGTRLVNLSGASVSCSTDSPKPEMEIIDTVVGSETITITIRSTSECEIEHIRVEEIISTSPTNPPVFTLERYDAINAEEATSVFTFVKSNYNMTGGQVKYIFTTTTTEGNSSTLTTEAFSL